MQDIHFIRLVARHHDKLLIAADTIKDNTFVLEIKAYPQQIPLLKKAMGYVMTKYPLFIQTTHGKMDLMDDGK